MSVRVKVSLGTRAYDVQIGYNILDQIGDTIACLSKSRKVALVTDSNVAPLYSKTVCSSLSRKGFHVTELIIPAGEASKRLSQAEKLCDAMIAAKLDRNALVIALGGGVVGDLAGFVAAIYYRGIPFIQIPTTVVAQVDSAVGGKTGVNAAAGKNLMGAFHQPLFVLADVATLDTLPEREFNEGMAEVIKHAIIRDPELFAQLQRFDRHDKDSLIWLIQKNVEIKAAIVAADEEERSGLRALLNFGHTIGHGIENAAGYGEYLHGEAISLGLIAAIRLSVQYAGFPQSQADAVFALLRRFQLPETLPETLSTQAVLAAMTTDKKFAEGAIRFVLSPQIGEAFVSDKITISEIRSAIESLRNRNL